MKAYYNKIDKTSKKRLLSTPSEFKLNEICLHEYQISCLTLIHILNNLKHT